MFVKKIGSLVLLVLLAVACSGPSPAGMSMAEAPMPAALPMADEMFYEGGGAYGEADFDVATANTAVTQTVQERLIIRTADLGLVVADPEGSLSDIGRLADEGGGWIVTSSTSQYGDDSKSGHITIRVPAEQFERIVDQIKAMAVEMRDETVSGQDVTEEYVDISARLGNLEATAERVRSFLDDARTVEQALEVNRELSRLEGEIESLKGRQQYLSQSATFSTIRVNLLPDELGQPIETADWRPQGIARNAIESLLNSLQLIAGVLIWVALYIVPLVLLLGLPTYFLGRLITRRRQRAETR